MFQDILKKLIAAQSLSEQESADAMATIMDGGATEAQVAAFLVALRMKGETVEEITGCARVMRAKGTRVNAGPGPVVDTCGTGGDVSHTFNVSTAAAILVAGSGVTVAKHGNRSVSSRSGSADVLAVLGVNIDAPVPVVERCLAEAAIGFLFAPRLHTAMKHAVGPRREIGVRTVFNLLGPLTNPAGARHQLVGVFDQRWTDPLARVLGRLGAAHALVVHGEDGLDEISTTAPTQVSEWRDGEVRTYGIVPEQFGIRRARLSDLQVDGADASARVIREILSGREGPATDMALINAGAALYAVNAAVSIGAGIDRAREAIRCGTALQSLDRLVAISHQPPGI